MKLYSSYIKKSKTDAIKDILLVKEGFSFPAFFFNILWFLQNKMWRASAIILIIHLAISEITNRIALNAHELIIIMISISFIIAINANHWYCYHIKQKGYKFSGYIFGKNKEAAKLRFVDNLTKEKGSGNIFSDSIFDVKNSNKEGNYFTI